MTIIMEWGPITRNSPISHSTGVGVGIFLFYIGIKDWQNK